MKNLKNNFYNKPFSYIYVENGCEEYEATSRILSHFPDANIVPIRHYKDVFNRKNQDTVMQKHSQQLILAVQKETWIYPGAPVCQSFGNEHFYYASLMMNCVFDCEYCYLQGMYPSGNIVIFVNIEDCFRSLDALLLEHPVYLCISFDSDLLALEHITGYVATWADYCLTHPSLTVEVRTKSANYKAISHISVPDNMILAWTLTPDYVIDNYEHKTPSLEARINAASEALDKGYNVRLCFDPVLYFPDYKDAYSALFSRAFTKLNPELIKDVSFGEFRVSCDYLKKMRKLRPSSLILQYPYDTTGGVAGYDKERRDILINYIKNELVKYLPEDKIFLWKGDGDDE